MPGRRSPPRGIRIGARVAIGSPEDLPRSGLGVSASLGVVKQVELDLTDSLDRELLGERRMGVLESLGLALARGRDQRPHRRAGLHVVRIVRADHLDLVPSKVVGRLSRIRQSVTRDSARPG